jgi:hypothetical protein
LQDYVRRRRGDVKHHRTQFVAARLRS